MHIDLRNGRLVERPSESTVPRYVLMRQSFHGDSLVISDRLAATDYRGQRWYRHA